MAVERESFTEKLTKWSKRIDVIQIGGGLVISIFNAAVGWVIIFGSAVTYLAADKLEKRLKKKR